MKILEKRAINRRFGLKDLSIMNYVWAMRKLFKIEKQSLTTNGGKELLIWWKHGREGRLSNYTERVKKEQHAKDWRAINGYRLW